MQSHTRGFKWNDNLNTKLIGFLFVYSQFSDLSPFIILHSLTGDTPSTSISPVTCCSLDNNVAFLALMNIAERWSRKLYIWIIN